MQKPFAKLQEENKLRNIKKHDFRLNPILYKIAPTIMFLTLMAKLTGSNVFKIPIK